MIRGSWVARTALLSLLCLAGCFAPKYKLKVEGDRVEDSRSLFVIAGDDAKVGRVTTEAEILALIRPDRKQDFDVFAQYKPEGLNPGSWRAISPPDSRLGKALKLEVAKDQLELSLTLKKKTLEDYQTLCVVIAVHGRDGWFAEKITKAEMASSKSLRLRVRPNLIERVGRS